MSELKVVGKSIPRKDGREKVTGAAIFAADIEMADMLHCKVVRSPYPHAIVANVDTSETAKKQGVVAVLTAHDIRGHRFFGVEKEDQPALVAKGEKACMVGDPVALVAAKSATLAEEASRLIKIDWKVLPSIGSIEEASKDEILIHPENQTNVCFRHKTEKGNPEKALAESAYVVEYELTTPRQEHAYLELETAVAFVDLRGLLTIYTGTQDPHYVRYAVASVLGIPEGKVRVISCYTGGGFGARYSVTVEIHAALLAQATGHPVRLSWSREESLLCHGKRHPAHIRLKLGASGEGKITALTAEVLMDGGAYAYDSNGVGFVIVSHLFGPYNISNFFLESKAYYTNNPPSGGMRGYGGPQASIAIEGAMEELAKAGGFDPVHLRLQNALVKGMESPRGGAPEEDVSLPRVLGAALQAAGPIPQKQAGYEKVGRGIAVAMHGFDTSWYRLIRMRGCGAEVEVFQDGSVEVRSGVSEIGTGITTTLGQVAAEVLGLSFEQVRVVAGDTLVTPKTGPMAASRSAYTSGNAVKYAAEKLRSVLLEMASNLLNIPQDDLEAGSGEIWSKADPTKRVSFPQVAAKCYREGVNLKSDYWFVSKASHPGMTFAAAVADVRIDTRDCTIEITNLVNANDVGKALNPQIVKGQILGGAIQGLGHAVLEELDCEGGMLINRTLADYLIPTVFDVPRCHEAVVLEEPMPTGPFGAKGVGEHSVGEAAAAILNAIANAVGARFKNYPATPEKIFSYLKPGES